MSQPTTSNYRPPWVTSVEDESCLKGVVRSSPRKESVEREVSSQLTMPQENIPHQVLPDPLSFQPNIFRKPQLSQRRTHTRNIPPPLRQKSHQNITSQSVSQQTIVPPNSPAQTNPQSTTRQSFTPEYTFSQNASSRDIDQEDVIPTKFNWPISRNGTILISCFSLLATLWLFTYAYRHIGGLLFYYIEFFRTKYGFGDPLPGCMGMKLNKNSGYLEHYRWFHLQRCLGRDMGLMRSADLENSILESIGSLFTSSKFPGTFMVSLHERQLLRMLIEKSMQLLPFSVVIILGLGS